MRVKPFALALLIGILNNVPAVAGDLSQEAVGTTGSEFLNLEVGARGTALGGAYTAVAADATAIFWNPAGLSQVPRIALSLSHAEYLAEIRYQFAAYAHRLSDLGVLAGGIRYVDFGLIPRLGQSIEDLGSFRPKSYAYELAYGQRIPDLSDGDRDISMGVTARLIRSTLVESATSLGGDIGIQAHYYSGYFPYHFGVMLQNLGQGQKFDQTRDTLPFRGKLGGSVRPATHLLLAIEAVFAASSRPYGAAGFEVQVPTSRNAKMFLRGGYNALTATSLSGFNGMRFGLGFQVQNLSVDYVFAPLGELGSTHRFSLSFQLPPKSSRRYQFRGQ